MKSISKTISSYRRQYKLSQEKLAALIGVSSTAVSKWERAVSIPDIDTICRLADLLTNFWDATTQSRKQDLKIRLMQTGIILRGSLLSAVQLPDTKD